MGKKWTDKEINFLEENYGKMPIDILIKELNRTDDAIKRKASYLNLTNSKVEWKTSDDAFIKGNYKVMSYKEMAVVLGKSPSSLSKRGKFLGINKIEYSSDSDLAGLKFNSLLVLERVYEKPRYWWRCKCDCGNFKLVETNHLKKGKVKSCGCYRENFKNKVIINEKYGRWTALERTLERSPSGSVMWLCKCDCGNKKLVKAQSLSQGVSKSCGCITKELQRAKIGSKNHNYKAHLTLADRDRFRYVVGGKSMIDVRKKAFERDSFTCQHCRKVGGDLNAHHLNSWNTHKNQRFDLNNLVTLCIECHSSFHKVFGYGNNTAQQFEEFKILRKEV